MDRMTRLLALLLSTAARLLPLSRRQWAAAIQAEAGEVPAGWRRLRWLTGGLWLVAREANVARKIVYALGLGVVAAAVAWAIWLSWRTVPTADPESATDRVRILAGASALLALPWVGRRSGVFGPVGRGLTPRLVRLAGCLAVCCLGPSIVRLDRHAGINGILGSGTFSWPLEITGLALLTVAAALPPVIRALRPQADAAMVWGLPGAAVAVAFVFMPLQVITILYVAGILAATSRRSPVPDAALAIGAITGLAMGLMYFGVVEADLGIGQLWTFFLLFFAIAFLVAALAGMAAGWRPSDAADADELRMRRVRQGLLAGAVAGAAGGLLITAVFIALGFMMVIGPLAGVAGGALGGSIAAGHPRRSLAARSMKAGTPVSSP